MAKDLSKLRGPEHIRELKRRSMDDVIVHNITNEDQVMTWDTHDTIRIPASDRDLGYGLGNQRVFRYIAELFMVQLTDKILTERADKKVAEVNAQLLADGKDPLTKYEGQLRVEPRTDNPTDRAEIMKQLFVRVEREYGEDEFETDSVTSAKVRTKSADELLIEQIMGTAQQPSAVSEDVVEGPEEIEEVE